MVTGMADEGGARNGGKIEAGDEVGGGGEAIVRGIRPTCIVPGFGRR